MYVRLWVSCGARLILRCRVFLIIGRSVSTFGHVLVLFLTRRTEEGDIVNLDVTLCKYGCSRDHSRY